MDYKGMAKGHDCLEFIVFFLGYPNGAGRRFKAVFELVVRRRALSGKTAFKQAVNGSEIIA